MKSKTLLAIGVFTALTTLPVLASSDESPKHIPGVFLGFTNFESETDFTYGIEYEYKFSKQWGAGFVYERTDNGHDGDGTDLALAALYVHPWKYLRVGVGFGQDRIDYDNDRKEGLVRASFSYDFHVGDFGVAPTLAFDFIDGETATVFGIAIVRPF